MAAQVITVDPRALQALLTCTIILWLKFVATTLIQANYTKVAPGHRVPEDYVDGGANDTEKSGGKDTAVEVDTRAEEDAQRWLHIVGNDLENIPFGLIVLWAALFGNGVAVLHIICTSVYTFLRIAHTIAYANAAQPWRSLTWLFGVITLLVCAIDGVRGVYTNY